MIKEGEHSRTIPNLNLGLPHTFACEPTHTYMPTNMLTMHEHTEKKASPFSLSPTLSPPFSGYCYEHFFFGPLIVLFKYSSSHLPTCRHRQFWRFSVLFFVGGCCCCLGVSGGVVLVWFGFCFGFCSPPLVFWGRVTVLLTVQELASACLCLPSAQNKGGCRLHHHLADSLYSIVAEFHLPLPPSAGLKLWDTICSLNSKKIFFNVSILA